MTPDARATTGPHDVFHALEITAAAASAGTSRLDSRCGSPGHLRAGPSRALLLLSGYSRAAARLQIATRIPPCAPHSKSQQLQRLPCSPQLDAGCSTTKR